MPSSHVLGMDHARGKASTVQVLRPSKVTGSVLLPRTTVKRKAAVRPTLLVHRGAVRRTDRGDDLTPVTARPMSSRKAIGLRNTGLVEPPEVVLSQRGLVPHEADPPAVALGPGIEPPVEPLAIDEGLAPRRPRAG
jgi:hypothetical protein